MSTEDKDHLQKMLRLFWKKPFPNEPDRLIELAQNEDEELSYSAMRAMHSTVSPLIRDLALKFASEGRMVHEIPGLLIKNYQDGDDMLVTELLKIQLDDFEYHNINMYARELFEAHPEADCQQAMLLIYENNPCSLCRGSALSLLTKSGKEIPASILIEAAWDCDLNIREEIVALTKADNA